VLRAYAAQLLHPYASLLSGQPPSDCKPLFHYLINMKVGKSSEAHQVK